MIMKKLFIPIVAIILLAGFVPSPTIKIALLKYRGGGDWYANPTSLPNLIKFCNQRTGKIDWFNVSMEYTWFHNELSRSIIKLACLMKVN